MNTATLTTSINLSAQTKRKIDTFINQTQREVDHVQETSKHFIEFLLRRLIKSDLDWGDKAFNSPVFNLTTRKNGNLIRSILSHSFGLQIYTFSGGQINHESLLTPLWLELALSGQGLRRMGLESEQFGNKVIKLFLDSSAQEISKQNISDPWVAYRLGLHGLSIQLSAKLPEIITKDLNFRNRLAMEGLNEKNASELKDFSFGSFTDRATLYSAALAYSLKSKVEPPSFIVHELEEMLPNLFEIHKAKPLEDSSAILIAQIMNSMNLYHLGRNQSARVRTQLHDLLSVIIPKISNPKRRAHVEGNAFYQLSILARKDQNLEDEINCLLRALDLDKNFSTLYYRFAQCLHNLGDSRAKILYEKALLLSPIDFGVANDYGCFLNDFEFKDEFEIWSEVCAVLFPESFLESEREAL